MRIAFLDRDGTIIKDYPDLEWANVKEPEFLPDSIRALKLIQQKGYEIIIITNQYLIHDGIISLEEYYTFSAKFERALNQHGIHLLRTYFCPHNDKDQCHCKKPKPGMILQALKDFPEIELKHSFLAGDSLSDILLANHFGIESFGIQVSSCGIHTHTVQTLAEIPDYLSPPSGNE